MEEIKVTPEFTLPSPEDVLRRPQEYAEGKLLKQREEIQAEITAMEESLAQLQIKLESTEITDEFPAWWNSSSLELAQIDEFKNSYLERQEHSKHKVLELLGRIGLMDDQSITAEYVVDVDHDLGGGYTKNNYALLARQAGVYLLAHQVRHSNISGPQSGLAPFGKKYVIHPEVSEPLELTAEGAFLNLGEINIKETISTKWKYVESETLAVLEAIHTRRMIDQLLPLLPTDKLQPKVLRDGRLDYAYLDSQRVQEITSGMSVSIKGKYYQDRYEKTGPRLDHIVIDLCRDDEVLEKYVLSLKTLEVRPGLLDSYDSVGNKHLHQKSDTLVKFICENMENNLTKD